MQCCSVVSIDVLNVNTRTIVTEFDKG